ncbi:hypothetical protein ONS95_001943 [Cadophora gregata]|uniref:uncharacterized protein n=1 Tax=Cadophora gregata TaxID=51156 RepID=UPI0026DB78D4|nr:uncharacterized protein ONS95_001943 [Cadophora gregata]KAK0111595.1 hypothetical protein ONS95_001943 [Cadophora gregata]KAK0111930.1 hypothetical protein ONS96_001194 [Cadophora gregata f. sp. sojae]
MKYNTLLYFYLMVLSTLLLAVILTTTPQELSQQVSPSSLPQTDNIEPLRLLSPDTVAGKVNLTEHKGGKGGGGGRGGSGRGGGSGGKGGVGGWFDVGGNDDGVSGSSYTISGLSVHLLRTMLLGSVVMSLYLAV